MARRVVAASANTTQPDWGVIIGGGQESGEREAQVKQQDGVWRQHACWWASGGDWSVKKRQLSPMFCPHQSNTKAPVSAQP